MSRTEIDTGGDARQIGDLRVRIDRNLCVGFGDCVDEAPRAFALDEEGIVEFVQPDDVEKGRLLRACDACPVDALSVWAADGEQIVP